MLLPPADIVALLSHFVPLSSCHVSKVPQNRRASGVLVYVSFSITLSVIRAVAVWPVVGSCTWNVML